MLRQNRFRGKASLRPHESVLVVVQHRPRQRTLTGDTRLPIGPVFLLVFLALGCSGPAGRTAAVSDRQADSALADTLKARIAEAYDFSRPGVVGRMNALYPDTGRVVSASG